MADELGDIVIGRPLDDVPAGAALHDPAALEDRHLVTEFQGLIQIVADELNRLFDTLLERQKWISGSSAENGSSMTRISASVAKARASPTRCCMPPESSLQ